MANVMVVDDELFYREMLADVLKKAGHEVFMAKDGKEALNILASRPNLEVILSDIVMPGLDGLAVLSKIKAKDDSIPVIMLSAHGDHRMVIQALRRGAFDYQRKPISAQELVLAVKRALSYRKLLTDQKRKLARLASLEAGAKHLSEMVVGQIPVEAIADEYELLESAVNMIAETLECERVSLMLLNPGGGQLNVVISVGMSKAMIKQESRETKKSVSSHVLDTGKALLVTDMAEDDRVAESDFSSQYKTRSFVVAPLKIGNKIMGTINANDKKDKSTFDEDDLYLLRTMSHHVSAAISHAIHNSKMLRDRERLHRLSEFQRILINYLEPEEMLQNLLKRCQEMMGVVSATVFLKDEFSEDLALKVGFAGKKKMTKKLKISFGESITGKVAKSGKTFLLNEPEKDKRYIGQVEWPGKGTVKNLLATPILISNTTIGVIRLLNKKGGPFIKEDAQLLKDVADSLSIAIRNMNLYEQLNQSVEEIIVANRNLETLNDELKLKARELEVMKKIMVKEG